MSTNTDEIKAKLDALYDEYKRNKSMLNKDKTIIAASEIIKLSQNGTLGDTINELVRFSSDVCKEYFIQYTKVCNDVTFIDQFISSIISAVDLKSKCSYQKLAYVVVGISCGNRDVFIHSSQIPIVISLLAKAPRSFASYNKDW